jgi:hypothetical protein
MDLLRAAAAGLVATCFYGTSVAGEADPIDMARQVGFVGCESLITDTFKQAIKSDTKRFSINYFKEMTRNSIDLSVTFGKTGDTVWQTAHFEKNGGYCYSVVRSLISEVGNCAGLLNKDEYFKFVDESAGALWSENKGGIDKIFIQSGNACNMIFLNSSKVKANGQ